MSNGLPFAARFAPLGALCSRPASLPRPPVLLIVPCGLPFSSPSEDEHLVWVLRRAGWQVYTCQPEGELLPMLASVRPEVLLLRGQADQADVVTRIIRLIKTRSVPVCTVAQFGAVAPGLRIAALKAGADVCLSLPDSTGQWLAEELLAVIDAAKRSRSVGMSRGWYLDDSRRVLLGPEDFKLPLTPAEGAFIAGLLSTPSGCLRRNGDAESGLSRRTDVMVSRLRAKAREAGVDLPLRAVRDWGYIFLPELAAAELH